MNDNAKRWVEALRSGEYAQTTGVLHRIEEEGTGEPVGFCCLGVACDLAVKAGVIEVGEVEESYAGRSIEAYLDADGMTYSEFLPKEVRDWLGLCDESGTYEYAEGKQRSLTLLNDGRKTVTPTTESIDQHTFEQVADVIESEPEGLFCDKPLPE